MASRIYATSAEYQTYTGQTPPSDIDQLLRDASRMLTAEVIRLCWYEVDEDGDPSNTLVQEAFRDAVCAQVSWWGELGDSTGASAVGWGSVRLGSAQLSRSVTATSGAASPAREIAPAAWDVLRSDDLTPDIFRLGGGVVVKLPGFLLRHEVTVEAKQGEGPYGSTYAAPVAVRCFLEQKTRLVRSADGDEVVSSSTAYCQLDAIEKPPPKSRVTLPDGTKTKVIEAHRNDGGGLPTPDHFEIHLE